MKKRIVSFLLCAVLVLSAAACTPTSEKEHLQEEISKLKDQKGTLSAEILALETEETALKKEKGIERYYLSLEVKQVHYNFNLDDHIKDSMNSFTFDIPTDEEFYNSVQEGDELSSIFRSGSALMYGSFGSNKVYIVKKYIQ